MSTPSDTRFDRRDALGKSAYESFRDQTDIGYGTKWEDLPNGIQTEWRNVGVAVANTAKHFPEPALSAGDTETIQVLENFAGWELSSGDAARDAGNFQHDKLCRENADKLNAAANRLTQLAARVKELESTAERLTAIIDETEQRLGGLRQDEGYWDMICRVKSDAIRSAMKQEGKL